MTVLVAADGLAVQRGERLLFSGLAFELLAGEVLWLRGRNGCGKSTLLRVLCGLAPPAAGTLRADRARLAYVAHSNALQADLTAAEALAFVAGLQRPGPSPAAVHAALGRLGVGHCAGFIVRTLSQGQRRRVALARLALADAPALWLLDEPFDALDDAGIEALDTLMGAHVAGGGAILLTSHQAPMRRASALRRLDLDAFAPPAAAAAADADADADAATPSAAAAGA